MEIRLITVKEDFEKAFNLLNQSSYPLSFYEFSIKHDSFKPTDKGPKLIGVFKEDECIGSLSYSVENCNNVGKILSVNEINQKDIKTYKFMIDFIDQLAKDEDCHAIKISKKKITKLNKNFFDKMENFLKKII